MEESATVSKMNSSDHNHTRFSHSRYISVYKGDIILQGIKRIFYNKSVKRKGK
jgi:hypothetical protein